MIPRRKALRIGAGVAAASTFGAPSLVHAQTKTLKITTWGGKWGEIMKATVLPAFEKEHGCTVSADQAFPFVPKLQVSPSNIIMSSRNGSRFFEIRGNSVGIAAMSPSVLGSQSSMMMPFGT